MKDIKKNAFIFMFIMFQLLLAVSGGFLVLYSTVKGQIPKNIYINDINIGGLIKDKAVKKLEDQMGPFINNGELTIKIEGLNDFKIKLSEIDASYNFPNTVNNVLIEENKNELLSLIDSNFKMKRQVFYPSMTLDENKLKQKLNELSVIFNKEPRDANIYLKDGKVIKIAEVVGRKLNIDNSVEKIKESLLHDLNSPIEFKASNNYEIDTLDPEYTLQDLEGADEVVSTYTTEIKSQDMEASVKVAANAINRLVLKPADIVNVAQAGKFSFNKYIKQANAIKEENDEGYNQVASTLFAAIILAGIKPEDIQRTPHKTTVDYIEPGLDTVVFGDTIDFSFMNTLDSTIAIFTEVKDRNLTVNIVSKKKNNSVNISLKTDIEQKIDPPVTYVENTKLDRGQKNIISNGKKGVNVKVYLVSADNGNKKEDKFLFEDHYDAEEAIVQIGPNTKWDNLALNIK